MRSTSSGGETRAPKRTLASVITAQVRTRVLEGSYAPGTQLNEVELAAQFATSRGPVRESLQRLVQEGLLVREPHRGIFVPVLTDRDIEDLFDARSALERAAMLKVIDRGLSASSLAALEQALDEMSMAIEADLWSAVVVADLRFHEIVMAASGSPRLVKMYDLLVGEARLGLNLLVQTYEGRSGYLEQHATILELLARQDREGLVDELEAHLHEAATTLRQRHGERTEVEPARAEKARGQ